FQHGVSRTPVSYCLSCLLSLHAALPISFLNVTFGSSFDADDTHVGAMLHPGVAVWSAALAVGEHVGASGPEVLAAVVAGYETIIDRKSTRLNSSHGSTSYAVFCVNTKNK